ncbi:hypothetical protein LPB137_05955 [Poseidonibacter parvus]|uniref:histidine kinase n=1 Tax=Poseidonibacter parvus TaxID=1850254 RepID=A0A1P8KLH5_9BACT|nr:PAS domain-containing protein [Poseidonibacter parvus]APW65423.1 hypothetical protein LPB137_05955 [Poseidonibacter parvus]
MIYILITLISFLFAWLAYKNEKLTLKNNEILENYNSALENALKKRTQALEDSEFRWKFAVDGNGDGLWDWNIKTNEVYLSKRWKEMLGYEESEIENSFHEWEKRVHPKDIVQVLKDVNNHLEEKTSSYKNEHRILCKNGKYKWILDRGIIVQRDEEGKPIRLIGTHTDIDERKLFEQKILEQKKEFETIFKTIKDGIAIIDLDTKFVNCNQAFIDLLGYSLEELLQKNCFDLTIDEDKENYKEAINNAINNISVDNMEKSCITKKDKHITVHVSIALLPDKKHLILSLRDISNIKLLEEQSKLASMGEMIGNIAHQWRQPLSVISTSASGMIVRSDLGMDLNEDDILRSSKNILKQAQYLSDTIDNFRDFLKADKSHSKISLYDVMQYTFSLINASISNNYITFVSNIDKDLYIYGSRNELSEAFINIINNSKDALKTNIKDTDDRFIFVDVKEIENDKIEISFKDSGKGIPNSIISRVFEPYFTSKHQSIGTGLGLAIVSKIIKERHSGIITVKNEEYEYNNKLYKGACFKVILNKTS